MPQTHAHRRSRTTDSKMRASREAEKRLSEDLNRVLSTESGRRALAAILDQAQVFVPVFDNNAMSMAKNAGKQELGLWLVEHLRSASQDNYLKMITENGS